MPTGGNGRHSLMTVGMVYALYLLDPTMISTPARAEPSILPKGTVVNSVFPAAVGMRSLLCNIAQTVVIGAFSRALPDGCPPRPAAASAS